MADTPPTQAEQSRSRGVVAVAIEFLIGHWLMLTARFAVVIGLVWLDLWSKKSVFAFLEENIGQLSRDIHGHRRYLIAGEWLTFMQSLNPGAAFGQLDSVPYLLVIGRSLAVLFLIWMIARVPRTRPFFALALMLVLAGAAGNLWDNLFEAPLEGYPFGAVRDFIDVYFPTIGDEGWHFPTFNVADSCITVGAVLLLLSGLGDPSEEETAAEVTSVEEEKPEPATV